MPPSSFDSEEEIVPQNNSVNSLLWASFFAILLTLFGIMFLVSNIISAPVVVDSNIISLTPSSTDANFSAEHFALANNQQQIVNEIRELNLFSDCIIDTENIRDGEVAIDDQGGFRKVSLIPLVCPRLEGSDST